MNILLFLIAFKGTIGFNASYYNPSLNEFNWEVSKVIGKDLLTSSGYALGGQASVEFLRIFKLSLEVDWFKSASKDEKQKLELIPIDGYIGIGSYVIPALLYFYIHAGYEICYVNYTHDYGEVTYNTRTFPEQIKGYAVGLVTKSSLEFLITPRLGLELSAGYRFVKLDEADNLLLKADNTMIPMNLWGPFFKLALLRTFR